MGYLRPSRVPLTRRDYDMIAAVADGLSNEEIAKAHNLSLNTVKSYMHATMTKVGAVSRAKMGVWGREHVVSMAQCREALRLLDPDEEIGQSQYEGLRYAVNRLKLTKAQADDLVECLLAGVA